jgi:hypothetical protein
MAFALFPGRRIRCVSMVLPQAALARNGAGELSAGCRVLNIEE